MFRHQRGNQPLQQRGALSGRQLTFPAKYRTPPSSRCDARWRKRPRRFHLGSAVMAVERAALQRAH